MASYIKKKRKELREEKDFVYIEGCYPTEIDGPDEYLVNKKKSFFNNDTIEVVKEINGNFTVKIIGIQKEQWRTKREG